jgi:hypothetical protein
VNKLSLIISSCKFKAVHKPTGILPKNALFEILTITKLLQFSSDFGNSPPSLLSKATTPLKLPPWHKYSGRFPVSLLEQTSKRSRAEYRPRSGGIDPDKLLLNNLKIFLA